MIIDGKPEIMASIGYPTHALKAPMFHNPWFEKPRSICRLDSIACKATDYAQFLPTIVKLHNARGALMITT